MPAAAKTPAGRTTRSAQTAHRTIAAHLMPHGLTVTTAEDNDRLARGVRANGRPQWCRAHRDRNETRAASWHLPQVVVRPNITSSQVAYQRKQANLANNGMGFRLCHCQSSPRL